MTKVFHLTQSQVMKVRHEAMFILTNILTTSTEEQVWYHLYTFSDFQLIPSMVAILRDPDTKVILEILQALEPLLKLDTHMGLQGDNQVAYKLEVAGGFDEIEDLEKHPNKYIYKQIKNLIDNYLQEEDQRSI